MVRGLLLKPPHCTTSLRHFSADPFTQTLTLLKTTPPTSWFINPTLLSSLTPPNLLKLTRQLPNYNQAHQFFTILKSNPNISISSHLPFAFQGLIEHAIRENYESPVTVYELWKVENGDTPLSFNAGISLIKNFARCNMLAEMMDVFHSVDKNTHVYNAVIAGFLNFGKFDDALKLLDEMLDLKIKGNEPNSNTVDIVFSFLLKRGWSGRRVSEDEVFRIVMGFGGYGVWPKAYWFTQVITRFCRSGECDKAWVVLSKMMESGCDVEVSCCNALLTGLGNDRDLVRMNLLMREMQEKGIEPNVVTYGIMIKHLCRARRVDQALEVLEKVEPDTVIYNTLIDGLCKVGRQDEGLMLMDRMGTESRCCANTITYNCLIDGFCKAGEIDKGLELFERMGKEKVGVNVVTFNTLLDGMCKHGRVNSAMDLFSGMEEKGLKGNSVSYTILITAFCNANNIEKAMRLFDEMRGNGCLPDAIVYYSLISGLCQAGRKDDASYIVSMMKESGFCLDLVCYNVLINGFCRKNRLDKASEIVKDMEESGVKPDHVTYNTLLSFFCRKGDFAQVQRILKKMTDDGLTPSIVTYGALIDAYCSNDILDEAKKIFRELSSSSKIPPNTIIYNMLIDSLCKNNEVEDAISLMDDMKNKKVKPNTTTYNALFKGLQQRNWLDKTLEFMDQMTDQTCNPDYITMEILTEWLSAIGETEKLRKFVRGDKVSASTL